jgi:glucose/arabinose dehydrogenase
MLGLAASLSIAACSASSYNSGASPQPNPPAPSTCVVGSDPGLPGNNFTSTDFKLQAVPGANGLPSPMDLQAPTGDARLFVAEREGRICVVQNGVLLTTPFLDISSRVTTDGEAGLISFAFDPNYATSGFVFVHFIENVGQFGDIVVERYKVSSDANVLQTPGAEVIRIPHQQAGNHYGGRVAFGPDGMLYLSTGDGGGGNNQFGHAQDAASHLGKMLRIDVSTLNPGANPPYAIPPDNPAWPVVGRNENWAIGLRNPFRYAFDGNQLYIADVGQDLFEEVDVVDATAAATLAGLNYGWSIMEGKQCFQAATCDMTGLTLPVIDYGHSPACAIIGGYVYRGSAIPALQGQYLFSDLCDGLVRTLNGTTVTTAPTVSVGTPLSFGQDGAGEIYVLTNENRVLKFVGL